MNLTSKRALQFMTMCAGVCALSASAQTTWVADNFEPEGAGYTNAGIGSAAGIYKMLTFGGPMENWYTNIAWGAVAGDASAIAANTDSYGQQSPMESSTDSQYLKLETEGQTLTRYVDFVVTNETTGQTGPTSVSFVSAPVYVDTLIKFTPSEDAPEITDPNIKVAIFVDVNSNLVVRHQTSTDAIFLTVTNSVFTNIDKIDPAAWYRLTLKVDDAGGNFNGYPAFQIWLDGTQLSHPNGLVNPSWARNGQCFVSLHGDLTLSQVAFQGTGSVDELVVSDIQPTWGGPSTVMLTLSFDTSMIDVTTGEVSVADDVLVPSGTAIVINAKPWYEITNPGAYFVGGNTTNKVAGTSMITNINGVVTSTTAVTNTIAAAMYSSTSGISTGLGGSYPADLVAAWAINNGLTPDQLTAAMLNNYLLNIDETINTTNILVIKSIVYNTGTDNATITVGATTNAVPMNDLNGRLVVETTDTLGGAWGTPALTTNNVTATEFQVTAPTGNNFLRARVQ